MRRVPTIAPTTMPTIAVRVQRVERYVRVHDRIVSAVGRVLRVSAVHSIDELSARLTTPMMSAAFDSAPSPRIR